jgi:general secretion pathway protein H
MTPISACSHLEPFAGAKQRGFTLLEILLVLAILGLAATLIIPNIGSLESRSFNAQIRTVNSLLNYARRQAVVNGQPTAATVRVNRPGDAESTDAPTQAELANQAGEWESPGATVRFRDSTDQIIDIEDELDIIFYPEGGSTGGTLLIGNDNQLVSVAIDPFTGRIETRYLDPELAP